MVASIPLAPAEEAYSSHRYFSLGDESKTPPKAIDSYGAAHLISAQTRLFEAEASAYSLAHEFVNILHDEFGVSPAIILQKFGREERKPFVWQGCSEDFASRLNETEIHSSSQPYNTAVYEIGSEAYGRYVLYIGDRGELPRVLIEVLIKQLESGLERCYWRSRQDRNNSHQTRKIQSSSLLLPGMVCRSEVMLGLVEQVHSLSRSNITVLITGESGTGKELVARAIHALSSRAGSPFIPFNCAAVPHELIESHLFGHRRGAFTGAGSGSPGVIGAAAGGVLFLDEIGEMAREIQPKLLRFLQDGEIQRLGETTPQKVDVRVIAATNRNLEEMVKSGDFRADLYYRLNVIQLHLPPLRDRREEVPLLAEHFLARYSQQIGKEGISIGSDAMDSLMHYDWPGNARQLENEIYRLVALSPAGRKITCDQLTAQITSQTEGLVVKKPTIKPMMTLADTLSDVKRQLITDSLTRHKGNLSRVAKDLGISRFGLRKMLSQLELDRQRA